MAGSFALPSLARVEPSRLARRGRVRALAASLLGALLVAGAFVSTSRESDRPIDQAANVLGRDRAFASAQDAGDAFLRVSALLRHEGEACERTDDDACDEFFAASAYAQVVALNVQTCTAPGIFDAREAVRRHVDDLRRSASGARLPAVPRCG